jgi:hypothetical protein
VITVPPILRFRGTTPSGPATGWSAIAVGFLLGVGQLDHAIVASLICFAGLQAGAPFGYDDWLGMFALVTMPRFGPQFGCFLTCSTTALGW